MVNECMAEAPSATITHTHTPPRHNQSNSRNIKTVEESRRKHHRESQQTGCDGSVSLRLKCIYWTLLGKFCFVRIMKIRSMFSSRTIFNFFLFYFFLTRKCLIEIKNLLYKRFLAKTAAHYTKLQTIQHKTVTDNIKIFFRPQHE